MKKKLVFSAVLFILFALLIVAVRRVDVGAVAATGKSIGLFGLNTAVHEALGEHRLLYKITQYLGYASILVAVCFAFAGLVQLVRRGSLKRIDKALWALAGLYVVTAALYALFEKIPVNCRPLLMPGETEAAPSFPSSHSMLFCVILGSAAIMAGRYLTHDAIRPWIVIVCMLAAAAGVVWRLVSGVHWLTDIVGSLLISGALLLLFSAVLDLLDGRQKRTL